MSFKCIHIADVHFRGLTRHEEYKASFEDFFEKARKLNPDVIFVGGDIVHSKTQGISPELIDILSWWFRGLNEIAPTHIILGNHDGLISNKHRQDAITPIINALGLDQTYLYKDSGIYPTGVPGYNWGVFSCFDEEGWKDLKPENKDEINIALYHGGVIGSETDINWQIEGEVETSFFDGFDFVFLGDIHKMQYLDKEKRIAYPGSTIQQNYGEDPGKGFLFWEIENKNEFTSTFHEVKHNKPFATVEWKGTVTDTVRGALNYPDGSRFRVKSEFQIPQAEIKHLYAELKEKKLASEIVFKFDDFNSRTIETAEGSTDLSLRDPNVIHDLLKQYYKETNITDEEWEEILVLLKKYTSTVAKQDSPRNIKWSLKKIKFDNLFSYGKNNVINFDALQGVVGLFGKNRSGKSSIPGAIMYGLYNTTDRGSIKNLHIINTRKGHCKVEIDFSVNGVCHRLERQSVKHENRKGVVNAVTHLNLFEIDSNGNTKDKTGEQRRETDKTLRTLVGSYEEFLMTSLASQGEINTFIKERATQRKAILSNFLDLNMFEKILNCAKEDSIHIKALLDKSPEREWNTLILEKGLKLRETKDKREIIDQELLSTNQKIQEIKLESASAGEDFITEVDLKKKEEEIESYKAKLEETANSIEEESTNLANVEAKLQKIGMIKEQFPIDDLKNRYAAQLDIEKSLLVLEGNLEQEKTKLTNYKDSISLLKEVPCGDKFPTCKFIKRSHEDKNLLDDQIKTVEEVSEQIFATKKSFQVLTEEDLKTKIDKYQSLLENEGLSKIKKSSIENKIRELESSKNQIEKILESLEPEYDILKSKIKESEDAGQINSLKLELLNLENRSRDLDTQRLKLSENVGLLNSELSRLKEEKLDYEKLLMDWRVFELIMSGVSKKGIPLQILRTQLPKINKEIAKILHGVVEFTIELEADAKSNAMDIFINYGDSKRIIECGSGMEKMISSIAIRVALINISSLPKCDTFIIDEGFGALDETNVEACNRLLQSLKKWFKNIIVISHVDAVKDSVDTMLDISSKGIDSKIRYE